MINIKEISHGIKTKVIITDTEDYLFKDVPKHFTAGLYHSWAIKKGNDSIEILANDNQNKIMAIRHREYDLRGVQFHPESILTEYGHQLIKNWLEN